MTDRIAYPRGERALFGPGGGRFVGVVDRVPEDGVSGEDVERRAQTAHVRQAARRIRCRELPEVSNSHGGGTASQVKWTRTRMNVAVPRTLVVAS